MTAPDNPTSGSGTDAERMVADIEADRADLGRTVDALGEKLDVKAQTRQRLDDARQRGTRSLEDARRIATDERGRPTSAAKGAAGAVVLLLLGVLVATRRRRQR